MSVLPPLDPGAPDRPAWTPAAPEAAARHRPDPRLTVLALPRAQFAVAGYLCRHGWALTLTQSVPDVVAVGAAVGMPVVLPDPEEALAARTRALDEALDDTLRAGFKVHAVESTPAGELHARLRSLRSAGIGCVVASTTSPRELRALTRAAAAPVLALPDRAAPAGGPAVVAAGDIGATIAAARSLATDRILVVGHEEAARRTAAVAKELGLRPDLAISAEPEALLRLADRREGLLVLVDQRGWWSPRLLRAALRARRPVLLVPAVTP